MSCMYVCMYWFMIVVLCMLWVYVRICLCVCVCACVLLCWDEGEFKGFLLSAKSTLRPVHSWSKTKKKSTGVGCVATHSFFLSQGYRNVDTLVGFHWF